MPRLPWMGTGRGGRLNPPSLPLPSVVVDDLDFLRTLLGPAEANPVLVVDPDAVLSLSVSHERLQPVSRRRQQIVEVRCPIEMVQLPDGYFPEDLGTSSSGRLRVVAIVDVLCAFVSERTYHAIRPRL